jgi:hypothetical protein
VLERVRRFPSRKLRGRVLQMGLCCQVRNPEVVHESAPVTDSSLPSESSIEILGDSVRGITYRHYAHRMPEG